MPSGFAVVLAVCGGGTNALVGVAIAAALLPPVVNTGLCFSLAFWWQLKDPQASWVSSQAPPLSACHHRPCQRHRPRYECGALCPRLHLALRLRSACAARLPFGRHFAALQPPFGPLHTGLFTCCTPPHAAERPLASHTRAASRATQFSDLSEAFAASDFDDLLMGRAIKPALPAASALSTMGPTVAGDGTTTTITTTTSTATATTDTGASATVDATIGDDTGATSLESAEQVATAIGDGGHLTTTTNITIVTTTTTTTTSTALVSSATPNAAAAAAAAATAAAAEAAVAATAASVVGVDSAPSSRRHPYVVVLVHGLWSFVLFLVNLARDPPPPSSQPCHGHRLRVHGNGT